MFDIEKLDNSVREFLGELSKKQEEILESALNLPITEKELFEKLGVDEDKFGRFVQSFHSGTFSSAPEELKKNVLAQEISPDELEAVAGGTYGCKEGPRDHCILQLYRYMYYEPYANMEFPNCASTVEADSWCNDSDACYSMAIVYTQMKECNKSWK